MRKNIIEIVIHVCGTRIFTVGKTMLNISNSEMKSENKLFRANEQQVNATVCKYLAMVFALFPVMLLLDVIGIFKFSSIVQLSLVFLGSFCTVSPFVLSKFIDNQCFLKYYILICIIVLTSFLGTHYYVGIYMTFMLAPIVSCMYFDKALTSKTILLAYIGYLISYYFRSVETRDRLYPGETVWETYIPLALGFTIEFIICYIFLYRLAERTHFFLISQGKFIEEIEKREKKLELVLGASEDFIIEYDVQKDLYTSSGSIRDWQRSEIRIENFSSFVKNTNWKSGEVRNRFLECMNSYGDEEENQSFRIDLRFMENEVEYGGWAFVEINIKRDKSGDPVMILGKLRDVTEEKIEEIKAGEAQNFDALTGMYYYASLRKIIKESEKANGDKMHQIVIVHLKNYAEIARCYGEIYRDFVVMNAAEVIKEAVAGTEALTCRLSPCVFLVYMEDSESVDSRAVRQNLNSGLRELYVGEKSVDKLEYDFGYYLGVEKIDDLFKVALEYVDGEWQEEDILEKKSVQGMVTSFGEETYHEVLPSKRTERSQLFIDNISSLMMGAKDQKSSIQIAMAQAARFFELDGIRIYPVRKGRRPVKATFYWAASQDVKERCDKQSLTHQVRDHFVENFGYSRIVDNTEGSFQDFFRQFGENPLLVSGYSSLILPVVMEETCRGILIYDVAVTDNTWEDEWKEQLLQLGNLLGNSFLAVLDSQSRRERETLFSRMFHEICMPMDSIVEMTESARNNLEDADQMERCLDSIDGSSREMFRMVNYILDFSKIRLAEGELPNEVFSLEDAMAELEQRYVAQTKNSEVNLLFERQFQENLYRGDSDGIYRVVSYLLENAIRSVPEDGDIRVLVREISRDNDFVEMSFCVSDNGESISDEEIEKMQEILENGNIAEIRQGSRMGLDYVIASRYAEMMDGQLLTERDGGRGMKFTFVLSLEIPAREDKMEFMANGQSLDRKQSVPVKRK